MTISGAVVLEKDNSPYVTHGNLYVPAGSSLAAEPGVVLRIADNSSMYVTGGLDLTGTEEEPGVYARLARACCCAGVLTGRVIPPECPLFGKECTPSTPVGPCMVSSEGSCAAYYLYEA
jgi:hypothetical protein